MKVNKFGQTEARSTARSSDISANGLDPAVQPGFRTILDSFSQRLCKKVERGTRRNTRQITWTAPTQISDVVLLNGRSSREWRECLLLGRTGGKTKSFRRGFAAGRTTPDFQWFHRRHYYHQYRHQRRAA